MSKQSGSTAILIPVADVTEQFKPLLGTIRRLYPDLFLLIVDDGSIPAVEESDLPGKSGLLRLDINQGKGAALQRGFSWLREKGYIGCLTLDADGQHDPLCIDAFLTASETADLVIGDRSGNRSGMPWDRRFSNCSSTWLLEMLTGTALHDVQCGYRWYRLDRVLELGCEATGFEFETQLLMRGIWKKWRLAFVPVPTLYLHSGSRIRRTSDTFRFCRMVWREWQRERRNRKSESGSGAVR